PSSTVTRSLSFSIAAARRPWNVIPLHHTALRNTKWTHQSSTMRDHRSGIRESRLLAVQEHRAAVAAEDLAVSRGVLQRAQRDGSADGEHPRGVRNDGETDQRRVRPGHGCARFAPHSARASIYLLSASQTTRFRDNVAA